VSAEDVIESFPFVVGGGQTTVEVHPLVRTGDHVVATLDLRPTTVPEGTQELFANRVLTDGLTSEPVQGGAVRLVDLEAKKVYLPGVDSSGAAVGAPSSLTSIPADGVRVQRVYAAPPAESVSLLFPGHLVDEVPVIDDEVPEPVLPDAGPGDDEAATPQPVDADTVDQAPVHDVERYTRQLNGAVQVIESTEHVEVNLGSDVLFATASAELGPQAQEALAAAAQRLEGHAPGVVDVVGHTDDVADDASNQVLSEQRAAAVADALAKLIDTSKYELRPSGRGESEPLVPNTSDANRQLNRRVTLTLTSEVTTRTEVTGEGDLPPFDAGPVAKGPEGVEVEQGSRPYRVVAPEARRVGDSLVVTVEVTAEDDKVDSSFGIGGLSSVFSYRGEGTSVPTNVFGVAVLSGSTAVYPYDYHLGDSGDTEEWRPLGDLDTLRRIDGGQTLTFAAVYPAIDSDTVAIQVGQGAGATPFRLTDIPVVDGE